jgi:tetratricopeptide (TPR) repeat protein
LIDAQGFSMLARIVLASVLALGLAPQVSAQDINLQPKYGSLPKSDAQRAADARFIASMDDQFKGDRSKAAVAASSRGWQFLRQGNAPDAMRRFNQAWLLDSTNGQALWGMAAIQARPGSIEESLKLFAEAERYIGNDTDFSVDHAKTIGVAGAQTSNDDLLKDAFARFERLYVKAPQHTLNLQNWAITLFYVGNYADAWSKVKLAEATSRASDLDSRFIATLQSKMPRP